METRKDFIANERTRKMYHLYDGFYVARINKDTGEVFVHPNYKYNTTELRKEIIEDVRKDMKAEVTLLVIQALSNQPY